MGFTDFKDSIFGEQGRYFDGNKSDHEESNVDVISSKNSRSYNGQRPSSSSETEYVSGNDSFSGRASNDHLEDCNAPVTGRILKFYDY
jgi:hypothetical protein